MRGDGDADLIEEQERDERLNGWELKSRGD